MNRTDVTYGRLDQALRSLGFTCRPGATEPLAHVYEHARTGASLVLPSFPDGDLVLEYHMLAVRSLLENYGIAGPQQIDAVLRKVG